jgi:hypothetical protein
MLITNIYCLRSVMRGKEMDTERFYERVSLFVDLVKSGPAADTSALEAEIDQLVYQLYGLTEEEIAIVEGASGGSGKLEVRSQK